MTLWVVFKMQLIDFGERLAKLRISKGLSARKMSFLLGKSANYINKIENNKTYPSMEHFFDICSCLEISQKDFFDTENEYPSEVNEMLVDYKRLNSDARSSLKNFVKAIAGKENK